MSNRSKLRDQLELLTALRSENAQLEKDLVDFKTANADLKEFIEKDRLTVHVPLAFAESSVTMVDEGTVLIRKDTMEPDDIVRTIVMLLGFNSAIVVADTVHTFLKLDKSETAIGNIIAGWKVALVQQLQPSPNTAILTAYAFHPTAFRFYLKHGKGNKDSLEYANSKSKNQTLPVAYVTRMPL
jgi:hypothetical protein